MLDVGLLDRYAWSVGQSLHRYLAIDQEDSGEVQQVHTVVDWLER